MLRLTVILALGLQAVSVGQDFTGQVFMLTEYFADDKCEGFAECDCCSTDLFFLTDKEFGMVSRCLYNDSYFRGTYSVKANKLTLTFTQTVVDEILNEETNKTQNDLKTIEIQPYQFTISKCGSKVRFQHATIKDFKNGSRYSLTREKELITELKDARAWKLISQ